MNAHLLQQIYFLLFEYSASCQHRITHYNTHTHNRLTAFVRDNQGRPVPEETLTHSHPTWSSNILYHLPPFTMIHGILFVHFTCLTSSQTTSLQVLFGLPLGLGPWTLYAIHFFTQSSSSFRGTCPYLRSLFCCKTNAMSSIPSLCLSSLLGSCLSA